MRTRIEKSRPSRLYQPKSSPWFSATWTRSTTHAWPWQGERHFTTPFTPMATQLLLFRPNCKTATACMPSASHSISASQIWKPYVLSPRSGARPWAMSSSEKLFWNGIVVFWTVRNIPSSFLSVAILVRWPVSYIIISKLWVDSLLRRLWVCRTQRAQHPV